MTKFGLWVVPSGSGETQPQPNSDPKSVAAAAAAATATKRKREHHEELQTTYKQKGVSFFREVLQFMPKRIKRFQGWVTASRDNVTD